MRSYVSERFVESAAHVCAIRSSIIWFSLDTRALRTRSTRVTLDVSGFAAMYGFGGRLVVDACFDRFEL